MMMMLCMFAASFFLYPSYLLFFLCLFLYLSKFVSICIIKRTKATWENESSFIFLAHMHVECLPWPFVSSEEAGQTNNKIVIMAIPFWLLCHFFQMRIHGHFFLTLFIYIFSSRNKTSVKYTDKIYLQSAIKIQTYRLRFWLRLVDVFYQQVV